MGSGRACGRSTFEPRCLNPALGPSGVGQGLTPAHPHRSHWTPLWDPASLCGHPREQAGRLTSDPPGDSVTHRGPQRPPRVQDSKKSLHFSPRLGPRLIPVESTASRGSLGSSGDAARTTALQGTGGAVPGREPRFALVWGEGSRATTEHSAWAVPNSRAKAVPPGRPWQTRRPRGTAGPGGRAWRVKRSVQ